MIPSPSNITPPLRIGSVSYLNARPLIHGLDVFADLRIALDVPSRLLAGLERREFDIALLPVIDYQRLDGLVLIPSGGIGCDGPTLTVRIFSRVPIGRIESLACDTDSHTSVALARIVLAELYDIRPEFVQMPAGRGAAADAQLLIGDKVVCEEPRGFDHQLDLGEAWKKLTGLPFVFAAWFAHVDVDLRDLPQRLTSAREAGLRNVESIIEQYATPRGWPATIARRYLTHYLKFEVGSREVEAMEKFYRLAGKHGLIAANRPLRRLQSAAPISPAPRVA